MIAFVCQVEQRIVDHRAKAPRCQDDHPPRLADQGNCDPELQCDDGKAQQTGKRNRSEKCFDFWVTLENLLRAIAMPDCIGFVILGDWIANIDFKPGKYRRWCTQHTPM